MNMKNVLKWPIIRERKLAFNGKNVVKKKQRVEYYRQISSSKPEVKIVYPPY